MSVALDLHRARPNATAQSTEDESDIAALIGRLTAEVNQIAREKTKSIQQITNVSLVGPSEVTPVEKSRMSPHSCGLR